MTDLEEIIRKGQDRVRGRPRNWRDDLSDWWKWVDLGDVFVRLYFCVSMPVLFALQVFAIYVVVQAII